MTVDVLRLPTTTVDLAAKVAMRDGEAARGLTDMEARLLAYFAAHPQRAIGRDELLANVWGYDSGLQTRTVDVTVRNLRTKLEPHPHEPRYILTVYGVGYRFVADASPAPVVGGPSESQLTPPRGTLFGRTAELDQVAASFAAGTRLLTVTGIGGIGKTRLATAYAARSGDQHPDSWAGDPSGQALHRGRSSR